MMTFVMQLHVNRELTHSCMSHNGTCITLSNNNNNQFMAHFPRQSG